MELPPQIKPYVERVDAVMAKYPSATQYGRYSFFCLGRFAAAESFFFSGSFGRVCPYRGFLRTKFSLPSDLEEVATLRQCFHDTNTHLQDLRHDTAKMTKEIKTHGQMFGPKNHWMESLLS